MEAWQIILFLGLFTAPEGSGQESQKGDKEISQFCGRQMFNYSNVQTTNN